MRPEVFREYDIRGHADRDFSTPDVTRLGEAFAAEIVATPPADSRDVAGGRRPVICVGHDCRHSSPRLAAALIDGVRAHADVIALGEVATPLAYFAAHHLGCAGGVMITGSHNPPEENGFKLVAHDQPFFGEAIGRLRERVMCAPSTPPSARGAVCAKDVREAYLHHAQGTLRLGPWRGKVVIDGGNGMGGGYANDLYRRMGFDVVGQYLDPDGTFPHHHPDPAVAENLLPLIERVRTERAALGLAFDGDGDRLGVITSDGSILWGDQLMILLGRHLLGEVPHAKFIGEVKCSQSMFEALTAAGGTVEMAPVGHSRIKQRLRETGAHLAGEMSGHLFFAHRYLGFDDGVYAGARVLEMLSHAGGTLTELAATLPKTCATPEIRVPCPDDAKFDVIARCQAALARDPEVLELITIDGVRARHPTGWFLLRASNTGPVIVLRGEAVTQGALDTLMAKARRLLDTYAPAAP